MKVHREKNEIHNTDIADSSPISTPGTSGTWHSKVFKMSYIRDRKKVFDFLRNMCSQDQDPDSEIENFGID